MDTTKFEYKGVKYRMSFRHNQGGEPGKQKRNANGRWPKNRHTLAILSVEEGGRYVPRYASESTVNRDDAYNKKVGRAFSTWHLLRELARQNVVPLTVLFYYGDLYQIDAIVQP